VIFDEASQVTPADAVTSILRARQVVVAGDDKQLPPTAFFLTTVEDQAEPEDDAGESLQLTEGFESVLDSVGPLFPVAPLDWHYRSQDERLIGFSNERFYEGRLVTFPGARQESPLRHVLVASGPTDSEESSRAEVAEVVKLILEHAAHNPEESLGVIAMGIVHAARIEDALRVAIRERPEFESFFVEGREDAFFVKNLERVQGDERDAIILSIGYGKASDGRLPYRFGPLNLEGGERRLNVAISRARKRMTVVSSFSHRDMDPARSSRQGPESLRLYLQYAELRGGSRDASQTETADALGEHLAVELREAGRTVETDLGMSGYPVDVVVRAPGGDGGVALEVDGRTYAAHGTARERDRLRSEHLERLGWRYGRAWALEWHRDPAKALVRSIRMFADSPSDDAGLSPTLVVPNGAYPAVVEFPARGPRPAVRRGLNIVDYDHRQLVSMAIWIESDGRLRTEAELVAEVMQELGFMRRGSRITSAIGIAVAEHRRRQKRG
jgi:very-short-patch-repair endonuclease